MAAMYDSSCPVRLVAVDRGREKGSREKQCRSTKRRIANVTANSYRVCKPRQPKPVNRSELSPRLFWQDRIWDDDYDFRTPYHRPVKVLKDTTVRTWTDETGFRNESTSKIRYKCPQSDCFTSLSRRSDVPRHLNTVHPQAGCTLYRCSFLGCDRRETRKDKIQDHIRNAHPTNNVASLVEASIFADSCFEESCAQKARDIHDRELSQVDTDISLGSANGNEDAPDLIVASSLDDARQLTSPTVRNDGQAMNGTHSQRPTNLRNHGLSNVEESTEEALPEENFTDLDNRDVQHDVTAPVLRDNAVVALEKTNWMAPRASSVPLTAQLTRSQISRSSSVPASVRQHNPGNGSDRQPTANFNFGSQSHQTPSSSKSFGFTGRRQRDQDEEDQDGSNSGGRRPKKKSRTSGSGPEYLLHCIGHHPHDPGSDRFEECKSVRAPYVSRLERHHDRHGWFCCTRCFEKFQDGSSRDRHKELESCRFKCVTLECSEYGTFPTQKCAHAHHDRDTSAAIWLELHRMFRPRDTVPSLDQLETADHRRSVQLPRTPHGDVPSALDTPLDRFDLSSPQRAYFQPGEVQTTGRRRALTTVAKILWRKVSSNELEPTPFVQEQYNLAMIPESSHAIQPNPDHDVRALESFIRHLWRLMTREDELTVALISDLEIFAHEFFGTVTSPSVQPSSPAISQILSNTGTSLQETLHSPGPAHQPWPTHYEQLTMPTASGNNAGLSHEFQTNMHAPPWNPLRIGTHVDHHQPSRHSSQVRDASQTNHSMMPRPGRSFEAQQPTPLIRSERLPMSEHGLRSNTNYPFMNQLTNIVPMNAPHNVRHANQNAQSALPMDLEQWSDIAGGSAGSYDPFATSSNHNSVGNGWYNSQ